LNRKKIAWAIVALWLVGLALLYRRSSFRSPEQSLAEAGMRVSPATYYYRLDQGLAQVGVGSSSIDTTTTRLIATDFLRAAIPSGMHIFRFQARSEARFTRALSLQDFLLKVEGDLTPYLSRGVVQGEGRSRQLQIRTEPLKKRPTTNAYDIAGLVFVPTVAPLPLMLGKPPVAGSTVASSIYDPLSKSIRNVSLKIEKDSLFTVTDSASLDSTSGHWIKAHEDTVRGWKITGDVPTTVVWVDVSGRMIAAGVPGGISIMRTAFEIAFENWRIDTQGPRPSAAPPPDSQARRGPQRK
jgi:hypothetical protein